MRRNFAVLLAVLLLTSLVGFNNSSTAKESNSYTGLNKPVISRDGLFANNYQNFISEDQSSKEQVMGWIIINHLAPYMEKSLKNYYGGNVPYWLTSPSTRVLEANFAEEKSYFIIKLQVEPYLGAHYPIGLDNFTFKINLVDNKVTLEKYEHIKSFKIPDYVKKQHLDLNLQ